MLCFLPSSLKRNALMSLPWWNSWINVVFTPKFASNPRQRTCAETWSGFVFTTVALRVGGTYCLSKQSGEATNYSPISNKPIGWAHELMHRWESEPLCDVRSLVKAHFQASDRLSKLSLNYEAFQNEGGSRSCSVTRLMLREEDVIGVSLILYD